jgi:hypothetical protein
MISGICTYSLKSEAVRQQLSPTTVTTFDIRWSTYTLHEPTSPLHLHCNQGHALTHYTFKDPLESAVTPVMIFGGVHSLSASRISNWKPHQQPSGVHLHTTSPEPRVQHRHHVAL